MIKIAKVFAKFAAATAALAVLLTLNAGCESSSSGDGGSDGDEVSFSKLNFIYGGFNGSGATKEGVKISNLSVGNNSWSFTFDTDLSAWGYAPNHLEQLHAFMKGRDGKWYGGMIHWQGSSTSSGDFHNVYLPGYEGFADIFDRINNPCEIAFVIIDAKNNRRSNVIKSTWTWNESRRQ